ncbi:MAG: transcription-repair coupling factor [Acutalibacteraceae bacterium]|nr:transcription-repair coupling factor [Acutalibacteraceae bacterium]
MNTGFKFLNKVLSQDVDYKKLSQAIDSGQTPIICTGLSEIHKAVIVSALLCEYSFPITVVTSDEAQADSLVNDLKSLGVSALDFPVRDYQFAEIIGESKEYEHKRIHTLSAVADGDFEVLVVSCEAAMGTTLPERILKENSFTVNTGDSYDLGKLCERLVSAGYVRSETVEGAGQFAVRGGILDIFTTHNALPCRVEFWGDEIDSISFFDIETQRRTDSIDSVVITPASEVLYTDEQLMEIINKLLDGKKLDSVRRERLNRDMEDIKSGVFACPDRYLPYIYEEQTTVLDYVSDGIIFLSESGNVAERLKNIRFMLGEDISRLLEDGYVGKESADILISDEQFYHKLSHCVVLDSFARGRYEISPKALVDFNMKRSTAWSGDIEVLKEDIDYIVKENGTAVVLAGNEKAARLLTEDLTADGFSARYCEEIKELSKGVTVTVGALSSGFELVNEKFMLITARGFVSAVKKAVKRPKDSRAVGSLDELKTGDLVVHTAHGIGVFGGIQHITNAGITKDYIKIKYAGQDVLYVPVTQLDLVSRYIGVDSDNVKLNKLGSNEWQKTRTRVKKAVKDMAKELTALYAKRMAAKGYAFSADTDFQNNFERRFPYEETEDQLRCVNEIKRDMERGVPMDRLLCGDVGFGKTEVALRAAFKCMCEGKQCALLVPTTILAWQHYNTALRRIGDLPVTLKLLSRFVPPKQQEKIVKDVAKGRVDMIIGTHRLISKDVKFKDLGLVIIDEEQRFGVAQKERLKELYPYVDILTLSATPIPRTLNMAMTGLRDMSTIDEAPGDRHPVQTYVLEQNNSVLYDAIRKELRRGGQVYYLHNRVESIEKVAARIKTAVPDARVAVAHGKMTEDALSDVWQKLMENEIDILVCTTIIETGVDVANVNTLIIEDADRMGLSQLHQLRGRVGRSSRRAYAYFCFKTGKVLNEDAVKRLQAIREFTEFGSGFKIAMRDLEIRGAGSVLGGAQHGNMEAVGYDMYLKLLGEAMKENAGEEIKPEAVCTIDLNVPAHIPESYINSLPARLGIYKRIADIENDEDVSDVIDELCDRFGEPPRSVMGLIDIALLRNKSIASGIYEIARDKDSVMLRFNNFTQEVFLKLGAVFGDRLRLLNSVSVTTISVKLKKGQNLSGVVNEIVNAL